MQYLYSSGAIWLWIEALTVHYAVTAALLQGRLKICYLPLAWAVPLLYSIGYFVIAHPSYGKGVRCWVAYTGFWHYLYFAPIVIFLMV